MFREMEKLVEAQPEGVIAEIAVGAYAMSPRPRLRHGVAQGRLATLLSEAFGQRVGGSRDVDWLFVNEPEIRSEETLSRLSPDVAGWRNSTTGWPDMDLNPTPLMPTWVAEVLSPSTRKFDRGEKRIAYGLMGVGWLWLLDPDEKRIETFGNVRGKMFEGPLLGGASTQAPEPFRGFDVSFDFLFNI